METFNNRISVTPLVGADKEATGFIVDVSKEISDQLIAAGWTPPTQSHPAVTQREESLIQMLRNECDHAARNNMRLPPTLEHRDGRIAVPEEYVDAVIEGWHREHGIPFLKAVQQDQPPTTA